VVTSVISQRLAQQGVILSPQGEESRLLRSDAAFGRDASCLSMTRFLCRFTQGVFSPPATFVADLNPERAIASLVMAQRNGHASPKRNRACPATPTIRWRHASCNGKDAHTRHHRYGIA
jgi:hypothetical protein